MGKEDDSLIDRLRDVSHQAIELQKEVSGIVDKKDEQLDQERLERRVTFYQERIREKALHAAQDGEQSAQVFYMTDKLFPENTPIIPPEPINWPLFNRLLDFCKKERLNPERMEYPEDQFTVHGSVRISTGYGITIKW